MGAGDYGVEITDFECAASKGILKGVAYRLGHTYEYVRQRIRSDEKRSWYQDFWRYWLAVDAESQAVADQYFFDFKARRDAMRGDRGSVENTELAAVAVSQSAASIEAVNARG